MMMVRRRRSRIMIMGKIAKVIFHHFACQHPIQENGGHEELDWKIKAT